MNANVIKRLSLAVLLFATIWLVVNAPEPETVAAVKPITSKAKRVMPRVESPTLFTEVLPQRTLSLEDTYDLFSDERPKRKTIVRKITPIVPAVKKVEKPRAPALPFEYVGMLQEGNVAKVFLLKNQALHIVKEGEKIEGKYQLKSVSDSQLRFIYLPLNITQTLSIEKQS